MLKLIGDGGREKALFMEVEEEDGILGIWDGRPGGQARGQAVADRDIGNGGPVMATVISQRWRRLSQPLMAAVMVKFCLHPSHSALSPELKGSIRQPPLRAAARIWRS